VLSCYFQFFCSLLDFTYISIAFLLSSACLRFYVCWCQAYKWTWNCIRAYLRRNASYYDQVHNTVNLLSTWIHNLHVRQCHTNLSFLFFLGVGWDWVHLVRQPLFGLLYQPRTIGDDECGTVGRVRICRGNRSAWRKPAPVSLRPPRITYDLTWARTRAAARGSRRLIAWAMAQPCHT
jgi:hypothetical protein